MQQVPGAPWDFVATSNKYSRKVRVKRTCSGPIALSQLNHIHKKVLVFFSN